MKRNYTFAKSVVLLLGALCLNKFTAQTYCTPTYSSGCTDWRITQVTIPLASFDNSFAAGTCTSGQNRTSVTINLEKSKTYTINVTTVGWLGCGMAIDFNKDGDFEDSGEKLFLPSYTASSSFTYSGTFSILSSVATGNYRMRIWNRLGNAGPGSTVDSTCGTYGYGTYTDYSVNISNTLSTEAFKDKSSLKIYPNPAFDFVKIENNEEIKAVEVYDVSGKRIESLAVKGKTLSVDVSKFEKGIYSFKIITEKTIETKKVIKK